MTLSGKTVVVTGATGSFGTRLIQTLLTSEEAPKAIRAFSRDELKQGELRAKLEDDSRVRYLLGDVRDLDRLKIALRDADVVIHTAALKQVPALEYNPFEAVRTNILGTQNVITAAIENDVELVVGLSTDKAVAPTNLYGATKLLAERLLAQAGVYAKDTRFAAVRYGNVVGSRGSVVPIFRAQAESGAITITDSRMTRFWITLDEAVQFVLSCLPLIEDGEVFVPKIPSARIRDIATAIAPHAAMNYIGIRPGEKIHETLLTEHEARDSYDLGDRYVIMPHRLEPLVPRGVGLPGEFRYSSNTNDQWLSVEDLRLLEALV